MADRASTIEASVRRWSAVSTGGRPELTVRCWGREFEMTERDFWKLKAFGAQVTVLGRVEPARMKQPAPLRSRERAAGC